MENYVLDAKNWGEEHRTRFEKERHDEFIRLTGEGKNREPIFGNMPARPMKRSFALTG